MDKCRELAAELGSPTLALQTEMNRAEALRRAAQFVESIQVAENALAAVPDRSARKADSELRELEVKTLTNLALTLSEAVRLAEADATLALALGIAREFRRADLEAEVLGGMGHLACLEKRFKKAARLFERAARKREASHVSEIDDLSSIIWAWSAAGGAANFDEYVQRLVDTAQARGNELEAAERLSDAARLWLPRDVEVAADLYAIAILLAYLDGERRMGVAAALADEPEPDDHVSQAAKAPQDEPDSAPLDPTLAAIARIIATAAVHGEMESPATSRRLKRELRRALSRHQRGAGKHLKTFIDAAWDSALGIGLMESDVSSS
jgi:tetratricopeptide (TPR) repeat protein